MKEVGNEPLSEVLLFLAYESDKIELNKK